MYRPALANASVDAAVLEVESFFLQNADFFFGKWYTCLNASINLKIAPGVINVQYSN